MIIKNNQNLHAASFAINEESVDASYKIKEIISVEDKNKDMVSTEVGHQDIENEKSYAENGDGSFDEEKDKTELCSDDDDENIFMNKRRKKQKVILSDDDDDPILTNTNYSGLEEESVSASGETTSATNQKIFNENSDSGDDFNAGELNIEKHKVVYRPDVFDAETSGDEEECHTNVCPQSENDYSEDRPPSIKKKHEKLNVKKQKQNLIEIHSTSQKMLRDSNVSLPYHRPRQRTLMEFLNRRKNLPLSDRRKSLKMSMKDMSYLKEIEERRKEVNKFYERDLENNGEEEEQKDSNAISDMHDCSRSPLQETDNSSLELPDLENYEEMEEKTKTLKERCRENPTRTDDDHENIDNTNIAMEYKFFDSSVGEENSETEIKETELLHAEEDVKKVSGAASHQTIATEKCEELACESDNEDDFRLHLDTEDFDTELNSHLNDLDEEENKCKDDSGCHVVLPAKTIDKTPRVSLLASKFPQLNMDKLIHTTPKLSFGDEGDYIDLESTTPAGEEQVSSLLSRFVQHSNTKKQPVESHKVLLGVVSKVSDDGDEKLVLTNVSVNIKGTEETGMKDETPGARLTKLKSVLRAKLLEQRERERQRREKEKQFLDSEKVIQDYHEDGLPDEEAELTDQSDTDFETESEPEENDVIIKDKKRKKSKYLDDEAEVEDDTIDDEVNNHETRFEDMVDGEESERDECSDEENDDDTLLIKRKSVNRLSDDDEEEEEDYTVAYRNDNSEEPENLKLHMENTEEEEDMPRESADCFNLHRASTEDLFRSYSGENHTSKRDSCLAGSMDQSFELLGSVFPGYQPEGGFKRNEESKDVSSSSASEVFLNSSSLTPFSKLKDNTQKISTKDNRVDKIECESALSFLLTPRKNLSTNSLNGESSKRSLLLSTCLQREEKLSNSYPDLLVLCSGKFTSDSNQVSRSCRNSAKGKDVYEDLIGLCSGKFDTQDCSTEAPNTLPILEIQSKLPSSDSISSVDTVVIASQKPTPDGETRLTSFEEEKSAHEMPCEDREFESEKPSVKRKKRKRIVTLDLSDNEDIGVLSSDESSDRSVDDDDDVPSPRKKFQGFRDSVKGGINVAFLDKEAELSGSEEDSEDEDEPNEEEDYLEREEGDLEKFDEEELRNQVGKAHLKSLIDNDKRELRLLQEMYLEDGDLHGEGRKRKFRWKNMDSRGNEDDNQKSDEEKNTDEVEDEVDWRKQRFEREKYLREKIQEKQEEVVSPPEKSASFKLVKNLSIKNASLTPLNTTYSQESFLLSKPIKRGSFLSRDNSTLQRLASFTKEHSTVGGAKQSGNFVFQTLTEEEVEKRSKVEERKQVKIASKPPDKKRRLERSFFSMEESVQSTSVFKHL